MDELSTAFRALVDELGALEQHILHGPNTPLDPQGVVEGYKWILSILQVAVDTQVWADAANPRFVEIVGPYKKWGGDNADAFYQFTPIDPARTYRVTGLIGDAVYLSLTVYGGPDDGRYSERIVGSVNRRDLDIGPDGTFEIHLGPQAGPGPSIVLEPDAVCAITRDYLIDPVNGRRLQWKIEAVDPPLTRPEDGSDLARRFTAALTFLRDQAQIVPLSLGEPNTIDEPYPVPTATFGWAAGDAAYAMGSFDLGDDEALVITGRSPECAFWNLCLWNQLLHTYNYDYERVTLNGGQVTYNDDGSWTIVVAPDDPGHPNWVSTAGHGRGRIWLRWFLPEVTPARPTTRVVPLDQVLA
ncbi:MAG TPA: DUF1214 domain-containing protein [Acidimicrobiales bacterium]|nr:DUF1214 domain-containing protein [Acidimicrobiales bacterium]